MASVKTNFKALVGALRLEAEGDGSLDGIGQFVVKRIQVNTRLGYSLAGNPETPKTNKLGPITIFTIIQRQKLANDPMVQKYGGLSPFFKPERSQLTVTGQLLDAITYSVQESTNSVKIFVKPSQRFAEKKTNVDVALYNINHGREFMGLDQQGIKTIKTRYVASVKRRLKFGLNK